MAAFKIDILAKGKLAAKTALLKHDLLPVVLDMLSLAIDNLAVDEAPLGEGVSRVIKIHAKGDMAPLKIAHDNAWLQIDVQWKLLF